MDRREQVETEMEAKELSRSEAERFATAFRQWFIEYPLDEQDEEWNRNIMSMPIMDLFDNHQANWSKLRDRPSSLNDYTREVHELNQRWWHDPATGEKLTRNVGEMLMLVVSEIAEAMEGHRKGLMDDKLPHRSMLEVELADAVIRIFDVCGGLGLDLHGAFVEKLEYNRTRKDHTNEARLAEGGKKY